MVVSSVEIVMFLLEMNHVLMERDIMGNGVFVGPVDFSEFNRRTESW